MAQDVVQNLAFVNLANKPSGFIKADVHQFLKEDCALWN
jgi:hypothetical protein